MRKQQKPFLNLSKQKAYDFESIAKEKTTEADKKQAILLTQQIQLYQAMSCQLAFKLDKDGISDVISVLDSSTYTYSYYIVKTTEKTEKDSD